jgi:DUF2971 family protein
MSEEFFYKYTDAVGAKIILGNLQLLYKSPKHFNDPFDCQIGLRSEYEHEKFGSLFLGKLYQLLFGESRPDILDRNPKRDKILQLWEEGDDAKKIQFLNFYRAGWEAEGVMSKAPEVNTRRIEEILDASRIFCVSEVNDDLLMWAHYADEHKGCVIKLTLPENPPGCWSLGKVQYTEDLPVHETTEQMVDSMLGLWCSDPEETAKKLLFTKSCHWAYEREWRRIVKHEGTDNLKEGYHCIDITKENILAVYLGLKMAEKDELNIVRILKENLSNVEIYKAEKDKNRFRLNFIKV